MNRPDTRRDASSRNQTRSPLHAIDDVDSTVIHGQVPQGEREITEWLISEGAELTVVAVGGERRTDIISEAALPSVEFGIQGIFTAPNRFLMPDIMEMTRLRQLSNLQGLSMNMQQFNPELLSEISQMPFLTHTPMWPPNLTLAAPVSIIGIATDAPPGDGTRASSITALNVDAGPGKLGSRLKEADRILDVKYRHICGLI